MNSQLLICGLLIFVFSSCESEAVVETTEQFDLVEITLEAFDEDYVDDTLLEGGPDVYMRLYLEDVLIVTTETYQNTSLPQDYDDELPFQFLSEDMGKLLTVELYDRDPSDDDFIGEVYWQVQPVQANESILVYDDGNELVLRFRE